MPLDLVYFTGGPRLAVFEAILEQGHVITRVFANDPSRWPKVQPTIDAAQARGIPVTIVARKSDVPALATQIRGALCFSAGFNYLFPETVIEAADVFLNVHGSLLPRYPGARTLAWAIEAGERESGVTVHVVDAGMDTGAILLQRSFALSPFETTRSLARKTAAFEPQVVVEALQLYESSGLEHLRAQPETTGAGAALENRVPAHSELDPSQPLAALVDKIRAADPQAYPAHFYWNGEKICVQIWRSDKPDDEEDLI